MKRINSSLNSYFCSQIWPHKIFFFFFQIISQTNMSITYELLCNIFQSEPKSNTTLNWWILGDALRIVNLGIMIYGIRFWRSALSACWCRRRLHNNARLWAVIELWWLTIECVTHLFCIFCQYKRALSLAIFLYEISRQYNNLTQMKSHVDDEATSTFNSIELQI